MVVAAKLLVQLAGPLYIAGVEEHHQHRGDRLGLTGVRRDPAEHGHGAIRICGGTSMQGFVLNDTPDAVRHRGLFEQVRASGEVSSGGIRAERHQHASRLEESDGLHQRLALAGQFTGALDQGHHLSPA